MSQSVCGKLYIATLHISCVTCRSCPCFVFRQDKVRIYGSTYIQNKGVTMQDGMWSVVHRYFAHYTVGHVAVMSMLCVHWSLFLAFMNSTYRIAHMFGTYDYAGWSSCLQLLTCSTCSNNGV